MDKNKKGLTVLAVVLAVLLLGPFIPFLLPVIVVLIIIYLTKKNKKQQMENMENIGRGESDSFRSEVYEGTADDSDEYFETAKEGFDSDDIKETFNKIGKNLTEFAKNTKNDYDNSSLKPKVNNAARKIMQEFNIREGDTAEDALDFSGTYDEKQEEIKGLKTLLEAGIIEKDEYRDRLREIEERFR